MDQNNSVIAIFTFFQIVNIFMLMGKDGHKFLEKKERVFFIVMPLLVIISLIWRPL